MASDRPRDPADIAAPPSMEAFFREVVAGADEGIIVYDHELRYVVWNHVMEELTGRSATEVLGRVCWDVFPHLIETGMADAIKRAYAGERVNMTDVPVRVAGTGREFWETVRFAPHRAASGAIIGVIGLVSDTTDRKRNEEALRRALDEVEALKDRLAAENAYLKEEIRGDHNFGEIVGRSPALLEALRLVEKVAATDATVLVLGETGTGKELFARAIHERSARRDRPLVKVNCGAIPAGLVESELFGHVKGAFTGALQRRTGRFELAHGGTILLDEVGELPLETQVKLLRVLQEHEFEPVGSDRVQRTDVRVIAATNRDLDAAVRAGKFRADLLYRLNVFPIAIPPLRARTDDVPLLVGFFLTSLSKKLGKRLDGFTRESMARMSAYSWPGNVRELQNVVERAAILAAGPVLDFESTVPQKEAPSKGAGSLEDVEREHIQRVLESTGGVIEGARGAAQILGLHPNTLRSRMKKLGVARTG